MADAAQAVHCALSGPRVPSSMDTNAAPMLGISAGTQKGEKRSMPFVNRCSCAVCSVPSPPMPVAMAAPMRSASGSISSRAWSTASRAAATASWQKRSVRRAVFLSIATVGSKSLTSQAILTGDSEASKSVIGPPPGRPARRASSTSGTPLPMALTAPSPVMTTRRSATTSPSRRRRRAPPP